MSPLVLLAAVLILAALVWARIGVLRADTRRLTEALAHAEGRHNALLAALPAGVVLHGPGTEILECNPAAVDMMGRPADALVGKTLKDADWNMVLEDGSPLSADAHPVARAFATGEPAPATVIGIQRGAAFNRGWLLVSAEPVRNGAAVDRVTSLMLDITARKRLEAEVSDQVLRDSLTGCFNRRYLEEFERGLGARQSWGCLSVDVSGLKKYNQTYGHPAGDEALVRMARFLMMQVRAGEAVLRTGGSEFAILLTGVDEVTIDTVVQRILKDAMRGAPLSFRLGWSARQGEEGLEATLARAEETQITVPGREQAPDQRGPAKG